MKTPTTFPHRVEQLAPWRGVIYQSISRGRAYFKLVYREGDGRKTLGFDSIKATMDGVADLVRKKGNAQAGSIILTNGDGVRYQQTIEIIAQLPDAPAINIIAADYVAARKVFGNTPNPPSMHELAQFYAQRRGLNLPVRTVTEAVNEMLKVKRAEGLSAKHIKDLENRLTRFGNDFQVQIADIDAPKISAWLRGLGLSPRSQNNFRGAIQTLATFAKSCGYLPRDWNELEAVPVVKRKGGKIEIFTPDEVTKLLKKANPKILPFIAIGAFAGLRSAELERLTWAKVDLKRGYIHVDAQIAKTNSRRIVPIQPNLAKWLQPYRKKQGKVCLYNNVTSELTRFAAERAGMAWKQNALRHSYASYRLAVTQDAAKVALEMGNSPQMIFQHYRELVTPEQGKEWFAVAP